jgi:hypothetical protein
MKHSLHERPRLSCESFLATIRPPAHQTSKKYVLRFTARFVRVEIVAVGVVYIDGFRA